MNQPILGIDPKELAMRLACDRVNHAQMRQRALVAAAGGERRLAATLRKPATYVKGATIHQSPIPVWVRWACEQIGGEWKRSHS